MGAAGRGGGGAAGDCRVLLPTAGAHPVLPLRSRRGRAGLAGPGSPLPRVGGALRGGRCRHGVRGDREVLKAGEDLLGAYSWGRYDLLMLPPSFPYGGMENPCLTFVTPTLLTGDRSLANVVAHEIAHSWTGNLVTNG